MKLEEDVSCSKLFPYPTPKRLGWVLRNQTTKEYVRICATSGCNGEDYVVHVSGARWLRLDGVLIMRICWTTAFGYVEELKRGVYYLYRGKWAGHRFDIVMQEDSLAKRDGWEDITAEVVSEARRLRPNIRSGRIQSQ